MKVNLTIFTFFLFAIQIYSQKTFNSDNKGFYVSLYGEYNLQAGKSVDYLGDSFANNSFDNSISGQTTYYVKKISFGGGVKFGGIIGYQYNEYFSSEIGVDYLLGGKNESNSTFLGEKYKNQTITSRMLQIKPTFVMSANFKKVNPYTKIGLVIGSGKIEYLTDTYTLSGQVVNEKFLLDGGFAFGFNSSVGLLISMSDKFNFYSELNFINLSYSPIKATRTSFFIDGKDVLSNFDVSENEFEFKDEYLFIVPADQDLEKPTTLKSNTYSFSSIGINFGIRYNL